MSVICGVIKNNQLVISCDSQTSFGSLKVSSGNKVNSNKLYHVNDSIIGLVGWGAIGNMIEHIIKVEPEIFNLHSIHDIYNTLINLHVKMKEGYFIETSEDDDQPVESSQLDALIINKDGLFEIGSYREVNQYSKFWAIGSGRRIALGAMQVLYEKNHTAKEIAEGGVIATCELDSDCSLPLYSEVISI